MLKKIFFSLLRFSHRWMKTFITQKVCSGSGEEMKNWSELASTWHVVVFSVLNKKAGQMEWQIMKFSCHVFIFGKNLFKAIPNVVNFNLILRQTMLSSRCLVIEQICRVVKICGGKLINYLHNQRTAREGNYERSLSISKSIKIAFNLWLSLPFTLYFMLMNYLWRGKSDFPSAFFILRKRRGGNFLWKWTNKLKLASADQTEKWCPSVCLSNDISSSRWQLTTPLLLQAIL